jgi:hypothetical protein
MSEQFQCRKVQRDPNKKYTQEQLNALDCSDGVACYEQQQKYNADVVAYNNAEEIKFQDAHNAWVENETKIKDWNKRFDAKVLELRSEVRYGRECTAHSHSTVAKECAMKFGQGWTADNTNETTRWAFVCNCRTKNGNVKCSTVERSLKCYRTPDKITQDAEATLEPKPTPTEEPRRSQYGYRHQNATSATIGCCSNYVSTGNGNINNFKQECNLKLQNITQTTGELETEPEPEPIIDEDSGAEYDNESKTTEPNNKKKSDNIESEEETSEGSSDDNGFSPGLKWGLIIGSIILSICVVVIIIIYRNKKVNI